MIADQTWFILTAKHRRVAGNAIIAGTFADSSPLRRYRFVPACADFGMRVSGLPVAALERSSDDENRIGLHRIEIYYFWVTGF